MFTAVLIGFNPVCLARKHPIENWDKTFYDVANQIIGKKFAVTNFIFNLTYFSVWDFNKGCLIQLLLTFVYLGKFSMIIKDKKYLEHDNFFKKIGCKVGAVGKINTFGYCGVAFIGNMMLI